MNTRNAQRGTRTTAGPPGSGPSGLRSPVSGITPETWDSTWAIPLSRRVFLAQIGLVSSSPTLFGQTGTLEWIRRSVDNAPLAMKFQGTTADECRAWQAAFGETLRRLLGPFSPPSDWETQRIQRTDLGDIIREELVLTAKDLPPLPIYLLRPSRPQSARRAAVLALHGHGAYGHHAVAGRDDREEVAKAITDVNYAYGRQLARRGFVVAAPCFSPFGDRLPDRKPFGDDDPCADTFIRLQMLGKLLIAENLRDSLWGLELLVRQDDVDPKKLGCVGLSYGGRMTMLTAAMEPRVRVAVISGALNVMQERVQNPYSCGAQIIPGLLQYGDTPEIGSLIAPRPCVWEVGSEDGLIPPLWAEEALVRIRRAYRALGAEENLRVDRFSGGHRWNGVLAYPLLEQVLA